MAWDLVRVPVEYEMESQGHICTADGIAVSPLLPAVSWKLMDMYQGERMCSSLSLLVNHIFS